jgi:hypothetical protein
MEQPSEQISIICICGHANASHENYKGPGSQPGKCLAYDRTMNYSKIYCKCEKFNGNPKRDSIK